MGVETPSGVVPMKLKKGITLLLDPKMYRSLSRIEKTENIFCFLRLNSSKRILRSIGCEGDSRSPSHQYSGCRAIQLGIVSVAERPIRSCSVILWYTRVSLYMDWIRSVITRDYQREDKQTRVVATTNVLLIVSVITRDIIAIVVSSGVVWRKSYIKVRNNLKIN